MTSFRIGWLLLFSTMSALADSDAILPSSYPVTRYTATWENSPFNREVIPFVAQTSKAQGSFAKSMILEGVVNDDSRGTIAYVRDNIENESYVVTSEANSSHPYIVKEANQSNDPRETKVTISNGDETAIIEFPNNSLTQKIIATPPSPKAQPVPQPSKGTETDKNAYPPGVAPPESAGAKKSSPTGPAATAPPNSRPKGAPQPTDQPVPGTKRDDA